MGLKKSFGVCHFNNGIESVINEQKYEVEVEKSKYPEYKWKNHQKIILKILRIHTDWFWISGIL